MYTNVRPATTQSFDDRAKQISFTLWGGESDELYAIMTHHLPNWAELFATKNGEYQDDLGSAFVLGEKGQFSDMWRKFMKLKRAMWEGNEESLVTEGVDEIILDLIGHCFLSLEMRRRRLGIELIAERSGGDTEKGRIVEMKRLPNEPHTAVFGGPLFAENQSERVDEIRFEDQTFRVDDRVWYKQHMGKSQMVVRIDHFDISRADGLVVGLSQLIPGAEGEDGTWSDVTWAHPGWLDLAFSRRDAEHIPYVDERVKTALTAPGGIAEVVRRAHNVEEEGFSGDSHI